MLLAFFDSLLCITECCHGKRFLLPKFGMTALQGSKGLTVLSKPLDTEYLMSFRILLTVSPKNLSEEPLLCWLMSLASRNTELEASSMREGTKIGPVFGTLLDEG